MKQRKDLTEGSILGTLMRFALPVFFALFLQALYGGVDLLVVGQFAKTADVSGVATGSMLIQIVTMATTGLSMGITILVGQRIGQKRPEEAGKAVGGGIMLFAVFGIVITIVLVLGANPISHILHAPEEAFGETSAYIRICGAGAIFIVAYNVLGAVFRGIGDSKTPLITVIIACLVNIGGDLMLVAVFDMGAAGAAVATVAAQGISVVVSLIIIRGKELPFDFSRKSIKFDRKIIATEIRLGSPVAIQEMLVGISFIVIQTIVNTIGVVPSAGVGVAEKVCAFLMLVPSSYMQSMSAFVAQNMGAGNPVRARKALRYGILTSFAVGLVMFYLAFFHGDLLSMIFTADPAVVAQGHSYLKAYSIDCLLVSLLFCFAGYYNGCEKTMFVMVQGVIGAFFIRIPAAYMISRIPGVSLFQIGLSSPLSTTIQVILCICMYIRLTKKEMIN